MRAVRRRGGAAAVRLPRVPHAARPPGRGVRRPTLAARSAGEPRCSRPRSSRVDDAPRTRSPSSRSSPPRDAPLAVAPAWPGAEGRSRARRARRSSPTTDDRRPRSRGCPASCSTTTTSAARCGALLGAGGRPLAAHGAKPLMRALPALGRRRPDPRRSTPMLAAYLLDPAERRYLLEDLLLRYANLAAARRPAAPPRASSTSTATPCRPASQAGRRALAVDRLVGPAHAPPSTPRACARSTTTIEVPLVRVLARMEDVGVARRRRASSGACNDELEHECARLTKADLGRRRRGVQRQLHAAAARDPLRPARARPAEEDEDRLLHRRRQSLEKLAGQHPIIEHLLRYREVEKLRSTYGDGLLDEVGRRRPHPRHLQPDRGPHRPAVSSDQPNLHNIPVRSEVGREFRKAFVPGARLRAARRRLQPDRAALHRPPGRGPRPDRGVRVRHRHPHRHRRPRSSASSPADVTIEQRSKAKMVSLRPGLRHGGLRPGPAPQHPRRRGGRDPRRLLRGVPEREGVHGAHRAPRPASGATPRRCSAGAGRSPSWRRATSASARPASARP